MYKSRILIVEDEPLIAASLAHTLSSLGYTVPEPVATGQDAINAVTSQPPDLVLMDIVLIGPMNGIEAAEKICAIADIPVVYVTAYSDDKRLVPARLTEPYGYLVKPVNKRELHATIQIVLYKNMLDRQLRESEEKFRNVFDWTNDAILLHTLTVDGLPGRFIEVNQVACRMLGYSREELFTMGPPDIVPVELHPQLVEIIRQTQTKDTTLFETRLRRKDGTTIPVESNGHLVHYAGEKTWISNIRDITGRRQAEEELRESEERFRMLFEHVPSVAVQGYTPDGTTQYWNTASGRLYGYTSQEAIGKNLVDLIIPPEMQDDVRKAIWYMAETGQPIPASELSLMRKDGSRVSVFSSHAIITRSQGGKELFCIDIDLTEPKRAETELARVNRALRLLSNTNQALVHLTDEVLLMNEICRLAVEMGGYRMACIGFVEQDEAKTLRPVAYAGFESGFLESATMTWADSERGRGPGGIAIRTGQPSVIRNISLDPAFAPWRTEALLRGYQSVIALPLTSEGRTFGALGIYARETDAFDTKEVEILTELAEDLAFGITALRTRARGDLMEEAYRKANEKLNLLSSITRHDILNQLMVLRAFLDLSQIKTKDAGAGTYIRKAQNAAAIIERHISFTKMYQDIGVKSPVWQNVRECLEKPVTDLLPASVTWRVDLDTIEVYADPLFEKVLYTLIDNSLQYGEKVTEIRLSSRLIDTGERVLQYEDNGVGIVPEDKEHIFERGFGKHTGFGLFLARQILAITGIMIKETGEPGKGARFEMTVPKSAYRLQKSR
jgi:PAS domain S-box-containing protein